MSQTTSKGFTGYKGGYTSLGKGTPTGDGKDQAMRIIADAALVELLDSNAFSSSRTSLEKLGNPTAASKVVMLARNGSLRNRELRLITKLKIKELVKQGVHFVVGDMPKVDNFFIRELIQLEATFTIYHAGTAPRIKL